MGEEQPLQVARCTKIIRMDPEKAARAAAMNRPGAEQGQKGADEQDQYVINIKQIAKFVVGLGERVAPTDVEEGMRVGYVLQLETLQFLTEHTFFVESTVTNIKFKSLFLPKSTRQSP